MKRFFAVMIALIMTVSAVSPAFAVTADDVVPPTEENRFSVWAEDAEFDPSTDEYLDIYVNVSNNVDGYEYLKFFVIYPECLTLLRTSATGVTTTADLTQGIERTGPDGLFTRALMTLRGYDVGEGNGEDTPEQIATFKARTHELLDGKKWTSPLLDCERFQYDEELDEDVPVDTFDNGRVCRFRFTYDPALNPTGGDLQIELWEDYEGALHSPNPKKAEWADEWAYYDAYGCTVKLPASTEPRITVSDAAIGRGDGKATIDVSAANNPGVWAMQLFFVYDDRMKFDSFANGDVFPDSALSFSPSNEEKMRDVKPSEAFARIAFKNLKAAFEAAGVSYENKLTTYVQYESPTFDDIRADGKLFSIALDTSELTPGVYDMSIVYMPMNVINSEGENVAFRVVQGKLTVTGEPCAHANTTTDHKDATCTEDGYTKVTCNDCRAILADEVIPAPGHDFSVKIDTVYNADGVSGYYVYKCTRCGETEKDYFRLPPEDVASSVDEVEAPYFKSKPVLDGVVSEAEWGEPTVSVSQADVGRAIAVPDYDAPEPGGNDLNTFFFVNPAGSYDPESLNMSYTMWLRWDENFYYIAVKVDDPDGHSLKNGKNALWDGDAFRTKIDPEGYNAVSPLGPELYDPYYDGEPWSRADVPDMAFGYTEIAGGFTEAWELYKNVGLTPLVGGTVEVSIAPAGVNYTTDTANGVTTYEIAIPWSCIDNNTHYYSQYDHGKTGGAIGREYGMSAVVYNADGTGEDRYNAALCWGSGILTAQQDLYTQTCGGSNRVVLTGDVIEPEGFVSFAGYAPARDNVKYPTEVDESYRVVLDYEKESDMYYFGYDQGGEWVEEESGNRVARWEYDDSDESGLNPRWYLPFDDFASSAPMYSPKDGSYTIALDVEVTGLEKYIDGFGRSFGFSFGGRYGMDYGCGYDFEAGAFRIVDNRTGEVVAEKTAEFGLNERHRVMFQYFKDNCEVRLYFDPVIENGRITDSASQILRMMYRYFDSAGNEEPVIALRRINCQILLDNVELYNFVDYSGFDSVIDGPVPEKVDPAPSPLPDAIESTPSPTGTTVTKTAAQTGDPIVSYIAAAAIALLVMTGCVIDLYRRRRAQSGK